MSIPEYIIQLKETQALLAQREEFEVCAEIAQLIKAMETRDLPAFIKLNFDVKVLTKAGFLPKKASNEEIERRIIARFGLNSIYEYASKFGEGMFCKYVRYANGIYDVKRKIEF